MNKHSQKVKAWIVISILCVSGAISSGSSVFCVGDEGHSRIERLVESCCDPDVNSESGCAFKSENREDTECGDCIDIEISNLLSTNRSEKSSHDFSPQLFTSIKRLYSRDLNPVSSYTGQELFPSLFPYTAHLVAITTVFIL